MFPDHTRQPSVGSHKGEFAPQGQRKVYAIVNRVFQIERDPQRGIQQFTACSEGKRNALE